MKKYANLQNKTFLDYTDDPELINKILDGYSVDFFKNGLSMMGRAHTFSEFAEITCNKVLSKEIDKQFKFLFNE